MTTVPCSVRVTKLKLLLTFIHVPEIPKGKDKVISLSARHRTVALMTHHGSVHLSRCRSHAMHTCCTQWQRSFVLEWLPLHHPPTHWSFRSLTIFVMDQEEYIIIYSILSEKQACDIEMDMNSFKARAKLSSEIHRL